MSGRRCSALECTVFRDLGLKIFAGALKDDGNGVELGAEEVGRLKDIDYIFTIAGSGEQGLAEHRELTAEAAKNPLWGQLAFSKSSPRPCRSKPGTTSPSGAAPAARSPRLRLRGVCARDR